MCIFPPEITKLRGMKGTRTRRRWSWWRRRRCRRKRRWTRSFITTNTTVLDIANLNIPLIASQRLVTPTSAPPNVSAAHPQPAAKPQLWSVAGGSDGEPNRIHIHTRGFKSLPCCSSPRTRFSVWLHINKSAMRSEKNGEK